jgi:hypothetical protein
VFGAGGGGGGGSSYLAAEATNTSVGLSGRTVCAPAPTGTFSCDGDAGVVTVAYALPVPSISTQVAVTGDGTLGSTSLGDTATLSGFAGAVTGETIGFSLYGPYDAGVAPTCTGTPVFTTSGTLDAGGAATTAATYTPTAAGIYVWTAAYPGDAANGPADEPCNGANEAATIAAPASPSPSPSASPSPSPSPSASPSPSGSVEAITQPPTDLGQTPTPPGTGRLPGILMLLAGIAAVAMAIAIPKRWRTRR